MKYVFLIAIFTLVLVTSCKESEPNVVIEERIVTEYIEKDCPEVICPVCEECPEVVVVCSTDIELNDLKAMNKRLAERLKTQYEKDPQTRSWSRLCLPDEYECLLK